MSEQDDASVDRFLDGLDDRRDEVAGEDERRRSRQATPRWEYMTWSVSTVGPPDAEVSLIDGRKPQGDQRNLHTALAAAGREGWEFAGTLPGVYLIFKRPVAGG